MVNNHLFVFPTAILGGAERVMFNVIYDLLLNNHNVTVLIMSRGKQRGWGRLNKFSNLNMIVYDYPSEKKSLIPLVIKLMNLSRIEKFDYIFSSHTHINGLLSFLKKFGLFSGSIQISRESTFIFSRFFGVKRIIFKAIYKFMYGKQDLIICQTQEMKDSLVKSLGYFPAKRVEVIPNPVNINYIQESINDVNKKNIIVACGRFMSLKKFDFLIEAFSKINKDYENYKLILIGDGEEKDNLKALCVNLNICDKVIFTGKIDNPIEWFADAKIGVISSQIEGFPNVLLEMMAAGTDYIISTPCTDGVFQLPSITVTESCSIDHLANALNLALSNEYNNSYIYQKYIMENRSANHFWNQTVKLSRS